MRRSRNPNNEDYYPFPNSVIRREASTIQQRVTNRKNSGIPVASDQVWFWIKERQPTWPEAEWERVFQLVRQ